MDDDDFEPVPRSEAKGRHERYGKRETRPTHVREKRYRLLDLDLKESLREFQVF